MLLLTKPRKNYCFLSFCSIQGLNGSTNAIVVTTPKNFNVSFSATAIVTSIDIFDYIFVAIGYELRSFSLNDQQ